ncbi:hypothetical protein ACQP1G_33520 [Nocardia sp. CA-107356]|uniref:hypothetical protein n=1 Tax=Nocardia sp. CA-107356 TaxID=3239972 RepID=UPI003D8C248E
MTTTRKPYSAVKPPRITGEVRPREPPSTNPEGQRSTPRLDRTAPGMSIADKLSDRFPGLRYPILHLAAAEPLNPQKPTRAESETHRPADEYR